MNDSSKVRDASLQLHHYYVKHHIITISHMRDILALPKLIKAWMIEMGVVVLDDSTLLNTLE